MFHDDSGYYENNGCVNVNKWFVIGFPGSGQGHR